MEEREEQNEAFRSPTEGVWSTNLLSDVVAQVSFGEFKKYMKQEMQGVKVTIWDEIAQTVNSVKARAEDNSEKIANMGCDITAMGVDIRVIREATDPTNIRNDFILIILEKKGKASDESSPFYSISPREEEERSYWRARRCMQPVSYTHLTLPTIYSV